MIFLPTSGALVAGRFRLRHPIGKGGMGQVWEAHDRELDSACAIKFILDHLARDPDARSRLVREARAVARLRSPHVVTILGVGEHADAMYLAMELLEGETLAARLERTRRLDGVTTLAIVDQVVQVLDRAHAHGIVHRDLKPDNIWLSTDSPPFIKVLDFGVAKSTLKTGEKQTATGALMGTPHYMSPEQASGDREIDHRSDLWALAVIAMECLSGRRPFESSGLGDLLMKIMQSRPPPAQVMDPSLPAALNLWWQRALAHDLEERFQNASDLVLGLRTALGVSLAPTGASPFAETSRGTWGVAPPARVPTLVTNITPAPPTTPAAEAALAAPTVGRPVTASPPVEQAKPSPWRPSSAPPPPLDLPPLAAQPLPTQSLSVESTQVADAPPPLTEPMTVPPTRAASFQFRAADAGSVGALTHTSAGGLLRVPPRRWLYAAAAACVLVASSFTWWRLSQPTSERDAETTAEPTLVAATPAESTVTQPLQPENAGGQPAAAAPTPTPPSVTVQPVLEQPLLEQPVLVQPVPAQQAPPPNGEPSAVKPTVEVRPLVAPIPVRPVPTTSSLAQESPAKGPRVKAPPVKAAAPTSPKRKPPQRPRATPSKSPAPAASRPAAGESAAELRQRLGF